MLAILRQNAPNCTKTHNSIKLEELTRKLTFTWIYLLLLEFTPYYFVLHRTNIHWSEFLKTT